MSMWYIPVTVIGTLHSILVQDSFNYYGKPVKISELGRSGLQSDLIKSNVQSGCGYLTVVTQLEMEEMVKPCFSCLFVFRFYLFIFRERRRKGEREGEKH